MVWLDDYGTTDAETNGVTARQRMEQALTDKAKRTFDALERPVGFGRHPPSGTSA